MGLADTSRFISLILRHKPETIGITLDEHGWANVKDLIEGIKKTRPFDMDMLEEIVKENTVVIDDEEIDNYMEEMR